MPEPDLHPLRAQGPASPGGRAQSLPDVIGPGLRLLFCGINPSLASAAAGHHFARPGNRFWPALHRAGLTERQLSPSEDASLLDRGLGLTNLVTRPTCAASELSAEELRAGAAELEAKVARYRPAKVVFLGVLAYRRAFGRPRARLGRQPEAIATSQLWVLPNPSGLQARYQLDDIADALGAVAAAPV